MDSYLQIWIHAMIVSSASSIIYLWRIILTRGVDFDGISAEQASWMERDFGAAEIKGAIGQLANEKSPGPEGFPMEVYRKSWYFMGL